MLDVEATFCYLGDMLCSGGGCDNAIAARYCVAWGKIGKLVPVLTTRHLSPRICGKVYKTCIHSAVLHGSETWGPTIPELLWLWRNHSAMIRWICVIKDRDEIPSTPRLQKLGIEDITSVLCYRRLTRYGHVYNGPCPVSNVSQAFQFLALENKKDLGRHGLNVWRLMSICVA